jgi:hypothetical protein
MRYFTKQSPGADEKGPYTIETLRESLESDRISGDLIVRGDAPGQGERILRDVLFELDAAAIAKDGTNARELREGDEADAKKKSVESAVRNAKWQTFGAILSILSGATIFFTARVGSSVLLAIVLVGMGVWRLVSAQRTISRVTRR